MARLLSRASRQNPFIPNFCSHLSVLNHLLHTNPHFNNYFLSLLPYCRKRQDLKSLNSLLIVHGLIRYQPIVKQFINQCCHLGFPDLALPAFNAIEKPSLYSQNLVLRSLSDGGLFEDVVFVYRKYQNSGFLSDNYTYPFVIKACAALYDVWFGNLMHCVVLKSGFGVNMVVQTALLDFYSKVGEMRKACKLFDEISQPDLVSWNALISGYSVNGFDFEVLKVFREIHMKCMKPNASTLASVLPVCSRVGVNVFGISLHGLAYKLGYAKDESLVPALISMYANCGDLLASRDIFNRSERKNIAIWNAIISSYTQNHKPENTVTLFQTMLLDGVEPNMVTFVSLLPSCTHIVECLHAYGVKFGFEKELSVVTALLSGYAKIGDMDSAEILFHSIRFRSLLLWNSTVSAYASHGLWKQSLDAFRLMQMDGFDPDAISIISLLSSCSDLKAILLGKSAHAFSMKNCINFDSNINMGNAFLAFYCDCNELFYSFRIFDRMDLKSVVSWNTMISGCVDNGELERGMLLFHQMRREEMNFDSVTLISILPSCRDCENLILGLTIHSYGIKTALTTDISLANALVSMYINCSALHPARLIFDDMPHKSVVSWNAILTGYRYHNLQKETIELFKEMMEDDQKPNYVTLLNVLPMCHINLHGKSLHGYIIRRMITLETPLVSSLMIMYARFENLTSCLTLFHIGDKTSISLWNTIISAHLHSENSTRAFSFFHELLCSKIQPDEITFLNLISACVHINNLNVSNSLLAYLIQKGFDKDVTISNALIDMYAKCGSISSARMLFEVLPEKDSISWSVMINGYGLHGHGVAALNLYSQMRLLGLKPDKVTYMSILSACSRAGCVREGRTVFNSMKRDGILPGPEHYACMVDLLGRAGHLNEAYEIVKNLPFGNFLESILGACLSHGNYRLGEEIGRLILDMNPKDPGPYVILHNIYAAAGKWMDANNVRLLMEQNQSSKAPGISLLDGTTC